MQNAECKMQPEAKPLGTPSNRNEKERLKEILDAEFMWSEKDCEAVADYLIASGLGFVDNVRRECGSLLTAKDVIINDLNEDNNRLRKENSMFWKKRMPIAVENERCPVCGTMVFVEGRVYCRCCGQALKFEESHSPSVAYGDSSLPEGAISEDTEIGMITNINDRS